MWETGRCKIGDADMYGFLSYFIVFTFFQIGKKEMNMSGLPVNRIDHYLSNDELENEFGKNGWKQSS